jgi:manganese efflux pump family protein
LLIVIREEGLAMAVILLGVVLGLDSFRASLALGTMRPGVARQLRLALAFGLCDGVAPLLGLALGPTLRDLLSAWAGILGPALLVAYGVYSVVIPRGTGDADPDRDGWMALGIPLFLSLDNLVAGFALGMMKTPIVPSAAAIGAISGLMSLAGFRCGALIGRVIPLRAERVGGAVLILLSLAIAFEVF